MSLQQVFYVSRAVTRYDTDSVQTILGQSRRNNQRQDVTGCLLFSGCYFAQVLEGRQEAVEASLERIGSDPRHVDVRVLVRRPIVLRAYSAWSMGYLHDLDLEDELAALLVDDAPDMRRVDQIMMRMAPDSVMGALQ
ncbi:MAG: BLUF domain-containing protein [Caldimonas sp.]